MTSFQENGKMHRFFISNNPSPADKDLFPDMTSYSMIIPITFYLYAKIRDLYMNGLRKKTKNHDFYPLIPGLRVFLTLLPHLTEHHLDNNTLYP